MPFRVANVVIGVWLFISAFVWRHSSAQLTNTWILGLLCVAFALAAMVSSPARYLNTALSAWLFISAFVLPTVNRGTVWNNALCAVAIFVFSLVPEEPIRLPRHARQMG